MKQKYHVKVDCFRQTELRTHPEEVHPWSSEYLQVMRTEKWSSKPALVFASKLLHSCTSFLCHITSVLHPKTELQRTTFAISGQSSRQRLDLLHQQQKKRKIPQTICLCVLRSKGKWAAHQRPEMLSTENLLTTVESHIQTWTAIKLNLRGVKTRRLEQRHRVTDKKNKKPSPYQSHLRSFYQAYIPQRRQKDAAWTPRPVWGLLFS